MNLLQKYNELVYTYHVVILKQNETLYLFFFQLH